MVLAIKQKKEKEELIKKLEEELSRTVPYPTISGKWPLAKLIKWGVKLLDGTVLTEEKLSSGKLIGLPNNWAVQYDGDSNIIRFYKYIFAEEKFAEGKSVMSPVEIKVINFLLDEKMNVRKIEAPTAKIEDMYAEAIVALMSLCNWGILRGDVFETLGIPEEKIKQAKEKVKENQRLFNEIMNRNKNGPGIDQLPHSWMSPAKKPVIALQGDGVILATDAKNKNDAIYTFGAGPCAILTVTAKDDKGNVKKVALAHIDSFVNEANIMNFLNKLKGYTLEISVISGEKNVVITILKALEKAGCKDKIHYFDVDIHGGRNDAVIITTDGKLYYGPREDFNSRVNPKARELIQLQRSTGLGGLRIINVEPEKNGETS